jgi:hypothetical protein
MHAMGSQRLFEGVTRWLTLNLSGHSNGYSGPLCGMSPEPLRMLPLAITLVCSRQERAPQAYCSGRLSNLLSVTQASVVLGLRRE